MSDRDIIAGMAQQRIHTKAMTDFLATMKIRMPEAGQFELRVSLEKKAEGYSISSYACTSKGDA